MSEGSDIRAPNRTVPSQNRTASGDGPVLSIVVPVWNEIGSLPSLLAAIQQLGRDLEARGFGVEVVITDNASTDGSWEFLIGRIGALPNARAFQFTRNFGFQESILYALSRTTGNCAAVLQSDLQDPPAMVLEFADSWAEGALTVAGRATTRPDGWLMSATRKLFYALVSGTSEADVERGVQDFYLLDRRVINDLVTSKPPTQLIRTYVSEHFGFSKVIEYARRSRTHGEPSLSRADYYQLALDGLLMSGGKAIRQLTIASFSLAFGALLLVIALITSYAAGWRPGATGWLSLVIAFLFLLSLVGLTSGISLEYLRRLARLSPPGPRAQCWRCVPPELHESVDSNGVSEHAR